MSEPGDRLRRMLLGLLSHVLPSDWSGDIVRDLEEAHGRRRRQRGARASDLWLVGQTLLFSLRFGLERLRELARGAALRGVSDDMVRDVRYAFRSVARTPVFFGAVILTLAIGIGANTAIFSLVESVLLAPLPYPDSERLVVLDPNPWTPAEVAVDLQRSAEALEALAGYYPRRFAVTGGGRPAEIEGAAVTPDFLSLLGAEAVLGRSFVEADARPGAARTVVLSHGVWRDRYGGAADVIGRTLQLDGTAHEIIGVLAPGFRQLTPRTGDARLWVPGPLDALGADVLPEGSDGWAIPVALLDPDVPRARSRAELEAVVSRYRAAHPEARDNPRWDLRWTTLKSQLTGDLRPALLVLQLAVGLVLLLACVNVANLLLVRFGSRRGEVAMRAALGASRGRLLRQFLTESTVLALLGGLAATALMAGGLELVLALAPRDLPRLDQVSLDGPVFLFTLCVSVVTGLLFGVVPAVTATGRAPHRYLKERGRAGTGSRRTHRITQGLVVAEVALTLVLVVGAGLLIRSFVSLADQEPGFRTQDVLAVRIHVPDSRFESVAGLETFHGRVLDRMGRIPGVEAVGVSNRLPLRRGNTTREYVVEGESRPRVAHYAVVSAGYFEALDIPLLSGRYVEPTDRRGAPPIAVIDASMRRRLWPDTDPIGARIRFPDRDEWMTIAGVVEDIRGSGLAHEPVPGFYIPYQQRPDTEIELGVGRDAVFLVRSGLPAEALAPSLRSAVWEVEPGQPVPAITPLEHIVAREVGPQRFRAALLGTFAAIALILAIAGIYGVVAHLLAERVRELGIRRALGATGGDVVRRVLRWGVRLTAAGIGLGLLGVLAVNRFLSGLLFGVGPTDAATIVGAVTAIALVTLVACVVPAWRATRIDPVSALRTD